MNTGKFACVSWTWKPVNVSAICLKAINISLFSCVHMHYFIIDSFFRIPFKRSCYIVTVSSHYRRIRLQDFTSDQCYVSLSGIELIRLSVCLTKIIHFICSHWTPIFMLESATYGCFSQGSHKFWIVWTGRPSVMQIRDCLRSELDDNCATKTCIEFTLYYISGFFMFFSFSGICDILRTWNQQHYDVQSS